MHDGHQPDVGDIVTIKPNRQYAAGIWFENFEERTVEWNRRHASAASKGHIEVVNIPDVDELGNIHLNPDRHLYLDDEKHSGLYYDASEESTILSAGEERDITIPKGDQPATFPPIDSDAVTTTGIELRGSVADPMRYGAAGDGTTDDTAAFQAACDAVAPDGTVVYHQDHQLNSPINSKGADVRSLGGTIYADPDAPHDRYQIGYDGNDVSLLYSDGYDDVTFSVRINGRDQYTAGAALWHGSDLTFSDCHVVHCANSGIQFMGNRDIGDPAVSNSEMRNNYVEGCMWNYVVDGEGHSISIKGNRSRNAHARHASFDPGEAEENNTQTNIALSDMGCEGHKPLPEEWSDIPGPSGQDYAIRPLSDVELRVDGADVNDWGEVGLGTTAADVTLTVTNYTFRNEVGDPKGTALYVPRGPVTIVESMKVYRAADGINLYVANDQGGHVSIRNCTFIDSGGAFNNAPATIPDDWVIENNYNQSGVDASPT